MEGEVQVESSEPAQIPAASSSGRTSEFDSENSGSNPEAASTEVSQESTDNKPNGFDKVEFTPEQLQRVNRLYGNMKRYESESKEFRKLNEDLVREFQSLKNNQDQIVTHLQNNDYQEAESRLAQQRTDAWNKGDFEGYNAANDKINEIKIQKSLAVAAAKQQPRIQQPQQQRNVDGNRVVDHSVDQGSLTPQEADITKTWISETDQNGNFKRPWASDPGDPRNYAAALEAQAVFNSPLFANKPIAEKLREVDRRMGIQAQPSRANVLGAGNLTNGSKPNNIKLDPAIEKIAIRTKFGGPKAKSDQDHVDAWKRVVAKSKGGR